MEFNFTPVFNKILAIVEKAYAAEPPQKADQAKRIFENRRITFKMLAELHTHKKMSCDEFRLVLNEEMIKLSAELPFSRAGKQNAAHMAVVGVKEVMMAVVERRGEV